MAALLGVTALALTSGGGVAGGAITTPPFALPDLGSLTLQTGSVNQVVRRDAANTVVATQTITAPNCAISPTYPLLAFATAKGVPGITGGTIGDKTKGSGTDCGLVEAPNSLTLSLGSQTSTLAISSFALDIETRKNVRILMTASFHGTTTSTYELRSGTSISRTRFEHHLQLQLAVVVEPELRRPGQLPVERERPRRQARAPGADR